MPERKGRQIHPASGLRHSVCWAPWSQDSKLLVTGHMSPQDHKKIACRTESISPWKKPLERDLINILWSCYLNMINPFYALFPRFHTVFPPSNYLDPSLSPALVIISPTQPQNVFPLHPIVSPIPPGINLLNPKSAPVLEPWNGEN